MTLKDPIKFKNAVSQYKYALFDYSNLIFFVKTGISALVLFFLTYFSFSWTMESVIHQRKEVLVPDVLGRSVMTALQLLSENDLAGKIEGFEFNDSVPIGTVLRQNPEAGITVREGKIVKIVFSQGGESVFVPNLVGLPLRNAELMIRQRQLLLGEVSESYSLKAGKGAVLFQDPKPETSVAKNTLVQVVVSAGKPPEGIILMPDFRQKKADEVRRWSSESGFKAEEKEDESSMFSYGTVIEQTPPPDSVISADTMITVTVSAREESGSSTEGDYRVHYEVSQSGSQKNIRIVAVFQSGQKEIFNGIRDSGSKIDFTIPYGSAEKIRIFVNGILVEERPVK
ncbi:MAG: PASTA domain-containing protein [Elusimicrobia bacterium]|nr:PASTA domain-containing protein [Elusimicrobiota bacterium]